MTTQQSEAVPGEPPVELGKPDEFVQRPHREIRLVMVGLVITMLLAMLDNLIVGTAMPTIVGELHGAEHMSWVVTSYTLATAASTPIWGKVGDLYGRKGSFLVSIVIFLLGSALSGLSQSMGQLIAFRAVQGLGAGGLMVGVMSIMGALVLPRDRGKYQGMFAAVMALATVGGPLIGGFITDHLNWRWTFYVNLPLGAIALVFIVVVLKLPKIRSNAKIDYFGAVLLTVGIVSAVLVTTWGGHEYAWGSKQILGLGTLGLASLIGFCYVEQRVAEPIIPLKLFRNRNFTMVSIIGFIVGFAMFGAVTFLPTYQQIVQGASATNSGLLLMPMMFGMLVVSLVVGQAITKTGKYRIFPIIGTTVMAGGSLLLSTLAVDTKSFTSSCYMVVLGAGMGFLMQVTMLVAQNSVEMKDMGVASSSATLFRTIGGSFGVALFGTLYINRLNDTLKAAGMPAGGESTGSMSPETLKSMPPEAVSVLQHGIANGMHTVFLWGTVISVVAIAASLFLREVKLRGGADAAEAKAEAALEGAL
ncbi:MDR family MFS transporter [Kitasatospora cineracea]|uniref:EmrB/QacA subfamily drug resistance transporter n=1 Tax=Kitasatospora cineracea TaxID=88074 RepID=A0A3N4RKW5_9ACTN|nr:EmrB/QacA subfamily drug resistance transporter [Kitasatospora cineracea]RPE34062.1 EmrB/QacA subfamily drug resistance transporter [Kitasatospora cineracea]